ncbi:hypothetical protein [Aquitalea magnusonii]|uniref:hypothetical protein n=1 Tax=Aquitalea magnusonii TaxID=332411 RepID=UPI0011B53937|nr:hypothetical protein [Aquitalea magnusonii]
MDIPVVVEQELVITAIVDDPEPCHVVEGIPGPPGSPGRQGDPGVSGTAASTVRFIQDGLLSEWVISHDFAFKPGVRVIDSAGDEVFGEVTYPEPGVVVVSFAAPFSGEAYLS